MNHRGFRGFLVVLLVGESQSNPSYAGVDRVPSYHLPEHPSDYPEESIALNADLFGDFRDFDSNLIPTLNLAQSLLTLFSMSPRQYEIVFCSDDWPVDPPASVQLLPLGFDVAGITGDCWSIVDDFPASPWANRFRAALNEFGLFPRRQNAVDYLAAYREHNEADSDYDFDVVHVARIRTET